MTKKITLPAFFDAHVHLRQGDLLYRVASFTDACCARALLMPNLTPPIDTPARLTSYRDEVQGSLHKCRPLFTFQLTRNLDPDAISSLRRAGAVAGKLYPRGLTTNSEDGFDRADFEKFPRGRLNTLIEKMADQSLILCLHGEMPGSFCMDRESSFLPFVEAVIEKYPSLRVVLEHITTGPACRLVLRYPHQMAATVTLHHLDLTLDDVLGDKLRPHHFCKPIPKRPDDREALRAVACTADNVFLGSDSAPHLRGKKECDHGCAGVFTAPVLAPRLAQLFESLGGMGCLEDFTSRRGQRFYGLPPWTREITLERTPWKVPDVINDIVPYCAGETLPWRLS